MMICVLGFVVAATGQAQAAVYDMGGSTMVTVRPGPGPFNSSDGGFVQLANYFNTDLGHEGEGGGYSFRSDNEVSNLPHPGCAYGYAGQGSPQDTYCTSLAGFNFQFAGSSAGTSFEMTTTYNAAPLNISGTLGNGGSSFKFPGGDQQVSLSGGSGEDSLILTNFYQHYQYYPESKIESWNVDLQAGSASSGGGTYSFTNFENVSFASNGQYGNPPLANVLPQRLMGSSVANRLTGAANDDVIDGREGDDTLGGGAGDDRITGGPGADTINCGPGNDTVLEAAPQDTINSDCETVLYEGLTVDLESTEPDGDDRILVKLTVTNATDGELTDVVASGANGLTMMPDELFGPDNHGEIQELSRDPRPIPATLAPGQVVERNHIFLSTEEGAVLLRGEVNAVDANDDDVRDAHYVEANIEYEEDPVQRKLEIMGAMEMSATVAHNIVENSSRVHGNEQAALMHRKLPKKDRKNWLGTAAGLVVSPIDETIGLLNGLSGEEFATEVPDDDVVSDAGKKKIAKAKKAVKQARKKVKQAKGNAETKRARQDYKAAQKKAAKVAKRETLTPAEARELYFKEKAKSDTAELWKMYDDMVEGPARALFKEGGATFRWMMQGSSYEGRQQIIADLAYMADLNSEDYGAWNTPGKKFNEGIAAFRATVHDAEVRRSNTRQQQINLIAQGKPQRAIEIAAESDSYYEGQVLRAFIAMFAPLPGEKYLGKPISFRGQALTKTASRSSANLVNAVAHGDQVAGPVVHGAQDLGQIPNFVDDFTFKTADIDTLIKVDELAKVGGTTVRDQRLAEQLNREVTAELQAEFPDADVEFEMAYRPKKPYEPQDSLAKPQIFGEKTLDPRSVEILGAPEEALGGIAIFLPEHPSKFPGWKDLPAVQKVTDLDLYETHLDAWVNFNKAKPEGKTALWKPALDRTVKADFGGGHSVEVKLEKVKLGKNAFEIKATRLKVDGELIHQGRARTIGGDLDPAVAIDANTGLKLEGEIERRGLEIWNREALRYQREFGFRAGGHGAPIHGDDLSPDGWVKFAHYGAVHLTPAEQLIQQARVAARAGLPLGTKIFPAGMRADVHLIRTSSSDTWFGPLGDILE